MNDKFITTKTDFYKLWITLLVTINAGATAWFFNNFNTIGLIKFIIVLSMIVLVDLIVLILNHKARTIIKKLEAI